MSDRVRMIIFLVSAIVVGGILIWGVDGLPGFGHYPGPYGMVLNKTTVPERHITDVVTSVMFDQRGLDTLGEEFILFAAVAGTALLLREQRASDEEPHAPDVTRIPKRKSQAIVLIGLITAPFVFLFGVYVVIHGHITVGGGFQGGIIIAAAWLLLYLADQRNLFHGFAVKKGIEPAEALGAAGYAAIGLAGLGSGLAFLKNIMPLGETGQLLSGGSTPVINFAVGIEVSAAFILLASEFLYEAQKGEGGDES